MNRYTAWVLYNALVFGVAGVATIFTKDSFWPLFFALLMGKVSPPSEHKSTTGLAASVDQEEKPVFTEYKEGA